MDQNKIGKFIATCRKEKGLTQMQLAEKLNISNRAVSKWETGKSMPDVSIMPDLCSELDISVNDLLSGERVPMENYRDKAEENMLDLQREDILERAIRRLLNSALPKSCQYFIVVILSAALTQDKPVLGICRGIQLINVLQGGTLYQDLPTEYASGIEHHMKPPYTNVAHYVIIRKQTPLYELFGTEQMGVNSYHHQAIKKLGADLEISTLSERR